MLCNSLAVLTENWLDGGVLSVYDVLLKPAQAVHQM